MTEQRNFQIVPARRRSQGSLSAPFARAAVVVTLAASVALVSACGNADAKPAQAATKADAKTTPPAMSVEVVAARADTVSSEVAVTGRIEAVQAIDVRPEVDGRIVQILVREGEPVSAGAPLFRVDDAELRAQVARATAERDLARQTLARTRDLLAESASAPADLERAEATARSAQAQLDLLAVRLARTTVRAPFAGVAGQRYVSLGDHVSPQVRLVSLQTTNPQRVVLSIPERYAADLQRGQTVRFRVAAYPAEQFTGAVEFVDPVVVLPARTITVKALARNAGNRLQPGMFAEARIATAVRPTAVVIPEDALMPARGGGNAVWVIAGEKAVRREITVGVRRAGVVEATSGVTAGEQVVVGGVMQLAEGAPVAPTVVARGVESRPSKGRLGN